MENNFYFVSKEMSYFFLNQVSTNLTKLIKNVDLEPVKGKRALFP